MTATKDFGTLLAEEIEPDALARDAPPCEMGAFIEWTAVEQGLLSERRLLELYAEAYGLEILDDPADSAPCDEFLAAVPIRFARQFGMLGLADTPAAMTLVVSNPHAADAIDDVTRLTGMNTTLALAPRESVLAAVHRAYERHVALIDEVVEQWNVAELDEQIEKLSRQEDLLDMANRAPIIKLVNSILFEAIRHNASDIHLQPAEQGARVRLRVDGMLEDRMSLPSFLLSPMVSRIKIMGRMNVSERRLAQDGRCTARIGNRIVDLRISCIPCSMGERVVMRLLDKSSGMRTLEQLGMSPGALAGYDRLLQTSHGIILITGPTGSGKTTTLYASLQRIQSREKNILTLEDPIEYQLEGISQTQVNTRKGMNFASGLRYVLRQDPDVIMVGEIRDEETARMAVQSSLTGHLVFSTLHTNDAPSAIARMLDLGVEPYLVASSLLGVLALRLVRRLCPACRAVRALDESDRAELAASGITPEGPSVLYREVGCGECLQRGFVGRVGIFELLEMSPALRALVTRKAEAGEIRQAAAREGFRSLRADGVGKVLKGVTALDEVVRVAHQDEE